MIPASLGCAISDDWFADVVVGLVAQSLNYIPPFIIDRPQFLASKMCHHDQFV